MKIRTGFVSNSSSTSFLAIMPNEIYERLYNNLPPFEKKVVEFVSKSAVVLGQECMEVFYVLGNNNSFEYTKKWKNFKFPDEYYDEGFDGILDRFEEEIVKENVYIRKEDF